MSDRPTTPPFSLPRNTFDASCRFIFKGVPCEWGEDYRPGGFHPMQLGDVLDGRYSIIRKLGYGSFSTVWLAVDNHMTRFVALKITTARLSSTVPNRELSLYQKLASSPSSGAIVPTLSSKCFANLLDSFQLSGPNGLHTVFVFEPLGPHLDDALRLTPQFGVGEMSGSDNSFFKGIPKYYRFPKWLGKRILRNVLHGLSYLHTHGVVHGDLHQGNILVTIRDLECTADRIRELRQSPEDSEALKRLDGKSDLWAPPYLLAPATLLKYTSVELDPYVQIADIGGAFHVDESPPERVVTPSENRAPEIHLGLSELLGPGTDIWSFGCLAFLIITGNHLFQPGQLVGSEEAVRDINLIQFSQVIGPLPELMFGAWERGETYFSAQDRASRRSEMLADGEDGTWDFKKFDDYNTIGENSESGEEGEDDDDGGDKGVSIGREDAEVEEANDHEDYAYLDTSGSWPSMATDEEEPLVVMAPCRSLEERFADKKPQGVDEVEEQQIVHLLRWIFQYDAAARPTADELLDYPWLQTMEEDVAH